MKKGFIVMGMTIVMMTFFMGGIALLSSCTGDEVESSTSEPDIRYEISAVYEVPDSLQAEFRAYVIELTRAATQQEHTANTSKSKNKGDLVSECHGIAKEMYVRKLSALKIKYYVDDAFSTSVYVTPEQMTNEELEIYQGLGGR